MRNCTRKSLQMTLTNKIKSPNTNAARIEIKSLGGIRLFYTELLKVEAPLGHLLYSSISSIHQDHIYNRPLASTIDSMQSDDCIGIRRHLLPFLPTSHLKPSRSRPSTVPTGMWYLNACQVRPKCPLPGPLTTSPA